MSKKEKEPYCKGKWKRFVCIVLVAVTALACFGVIGNVLKDDNKRTIKASAFSVGGLDDNGKYVENKQAIFTEEAFECIGLCIKPDFKEEVTYDVYYYDYNEKFIEAKKGLTEVYAEDFPLAKMCRVVIYPEIPEGVKEKDFTINFFEAYSYAKKVKITVDKNQNYPYEELGNLYVEENASRGNSFLFGDTITFKTDASAKVSEKIYVSGDYKYYDVFVKRTSSNTSRVMAAIADMEDDKVLVSMTADVKELEVGEWVKVTLKAGKLGTSAYLIVRMAIDAECYIFAYN